MKTTFYKGLDSVQTPTNYSCLLLKHWIFQMKHFPFIPVKNHSSNKHFHKVLLEEWIENDVTK